ncbi:MAG: RtcB family protein [Candidatus Nanohaloarchaea archaeon]
MELNKISDNIYEIPREGDMKKPARVYASEEILEKMKDDRTLEQVKNVATLPGIQKFSIVLPDGHQGYGFPIGGVAAVDMEDGVISPGGIGYDINCLTGDSRVLTEFGRSKKIEDFKSDFEDETVEVPAENNETGNVHLFTENKKEVYRIETETGETIKASKDHPILTPEGKKTVQDLNEGSRILVRPFEGIEDEEPEERTLLTENDFGGEDAQVIEFLEEKNLLPLKTTDRKFNILLKLVGFHTGGGSFGSEGQTWFYADKEDLENIREDIKELGLTPSKIYSRERIHELPGKESFERTEHSIRTNSRAFRKLLIELGAPEGKKTRQRFSTPDYFEHLASWQKALYLSAFFGAEMSSPKAQHNKNLYCPKISQNKSKNVSDSGLRFMEDIKKILEELGIQTNEIESFETCETQDGAVERFRLGVKNDSQNLISFFTQIGYRYNKQKQKKAVKAVQYLKTKQKAIEQRENIAEESLELYNNGVAPKEIKQEFEINNRFIERSIYSGRKTVPRPGNTFPDFEEYAKDLVVNDNLTTPTTIRNIEKIGERKVYDIGVNHEAHAFIANQFAVGNCGVRVLKTNLEYSDIKGREEQLANILKNKIPVGLGKGGYIETDREDLKDILEKGAEWMLEKGYAEEEDLERCEENGRLDGDASKVPKEAIDRGISQVGSLGSGNHFLEVQRVSEIYDEEKAEAYGLEEDQVLVMIHSGSRGLGHQTCTHYLRKFEKNYPDIVEKIPEKELIYAPIGDRLAEDYRNAMYAAANYAWANRQAITQGVRDCFGRIFDEVDIELVYDVCHNIAKEETHEVEGEMKDLLVHRKGATRAMPKGRSEVPDVYSKVGQPVLIPGSMGTSSYILSGGKNSLDLSFGSTAHGAGRIKSRTRAKQDYWGETVQKELEREGIYIRAASGSTVAEEAPGAYKDVDEVIQVSDMLGIGEKVARMKPVVNIKG